MSQPDSNQNEPSKMRKLLGQNPDENSSLPSSSPSPLSRLPKGGGNALKTPASEATKSSKPFIPPATSKPKKEAKSNVSSKNDTGSYRFMPAFWTIASVISMLVNIGVVIVLIIAIQLLGGTKAALDFAQSQANGLLGGLHSNFVKMDAASIKTQIPVNANIPLNITVPVQATTRITLAEPAVIRNAQVIINTGSLDINASATVTLPANTPLTVNLDFPLQVTDTIPISLMVDVNIPLKDTELHEPFVGLQKVVEPYYCLLQPNIVVNDINVCENAAPIFPVAPSEPVSP